MSIIVSERIDWFFWQRDKQVQGDKGHYQGTKKSRQRKSAHGNRHESSLWREKYKKRIIDCQDVISLSLFGTAISISRRRILFSDIQLCWVATRSRQDPGKVGFLAMRLISNNPSPVLISIRSLLWEQQIGRL